jgi:lysophospholipase L1-like esterase
MCHWEMALSAKGGRSVVALQYIKFNLNEWADLMQTNRLTTSAQKKVPRKPRLNLLLSGILMLAISVGAVSLSAQSSAASKHWVGTWAAAPYNTNNSENQPPMALSNNTLRQIIRVSIGSDTLRIKFSNYTFNEAITLNKVTIAVSPNAAKSAITTSTLKELQFDGKPNVTINAKGEVYSDPVAFDLQPGMLLAITTYYGQCKSSTSMTFHYGSRTNSYIVAGDKTTAADFTGASVKECWYTISAVDVLAPATAAAVAVIGNSITDGYGVHDGPPNKWTDFFSQKLLANDATKQVGVLNLGIGATLVTASGNGAASGVDRFEHDILGQAGVHWVIIFYGVNDIGGNVSATNIINGLKKMVSLTRAKDASIRIYGATITPFNGNSYYSSSHEQARKDVNSWIRTDKSLDGVLDFDKVLQNPSDPSRLQTQYNNDWLHPSAAGYKALGESIDPELFKPPVVAIKPARMTIAPVTASSMCIVNGKAIVVFTLQSAGSVALKVSTLTGKVVAAVNQRATAAGAQAIELDSRGWSKGTYVYSIEAEGFTTQGNVIVQ